MRLLFLFFTLVPLVELFLLVRVGAVIGPLNTLLLVIVTGAAGAFLARREGAAVLREWQQATAAGRVPAQGVMSGLLVLVGGVLLITPGILTDVAGLALLWPPSRHAGTRLLRRYLERQVQSGRVRVHTYRDSGGPFGPASQAGPFASGVSGRRDEVIDTSGEDVT